MEDTQQHYDRERRHDDDDRRHDDDIVRRADVARLHQRIDALGTSLVDSTKEMIRGMDSLSTQVQVSLAKCDMCRPIVLGNGKEGLPVRMDRIEQNLAVHGKLFWILVGGVPVLISAIIGAVVHFL